MSDINQGSPEPIRDELPQQEPVAREHSGPVKHDPLTAFSDEELAMELARRNENIILLAVNSRIGGDDVELIARGNSALLVGHFERVKPSLFGHDSKEIAVGRHGLRS